MDLSYFGIALGTLFLSKRNSTKKSMELSCFAIALGTCFLGNEMCNKVNGTICWSLVGNYWALDWELIGHWIRKVQESQ
jgi:hypothetical protein